MKGSIIWSHIKRVTPLRTAALYALIGGVWILFSDRVLGFIIQDRSLYIQLSTAKGWFYVVVTAVLLYVLFYWGLNSLQESEEALQASYKELLLTHGELATTHQEMEATHEELVAAEEELKQQFDEVREHEAYYRRIYEGVSSGILVQDRFGKVLHANDAACRLLKRSRIQLTNPTLTGGIWQAKYSDGTPFSCEGLPEGVLWEPGTPIYREIEVSGENELKSWISVHSDPIRNMKAEHDQELVTTLVDITEKKYLENYEHLLKEIDQLVLQEKSLPEIQQFLCDQLVKEMNFSWVWIGTKEEDGSVAFCAQAGIEELDPLIVRWDESLQGQGVVGKAIQTGEKQVDVLEGNPRFVAWEDFFAKNKFRSVAALPLSHQRETFGTLSLFAREADFFNEKRVAFLERFSLQLALAFNSAKDREHLEHYRLLAEDSLEIILFIRADGRIIDANETAVNRYGYTREELTHMLFHNLRLPEDRLELLNQLQEAQAGAHFDCLHLCKDGSVFPVEVSSKGAILNGNPIILSIIRDTTERKNAEAIVWLEKERAQVTLDSIGDAVITTDVHGKIEYLNPVAVTLTGWTNEEAVGHSLEKVFNIVNEETGKTVESPVVRCIREECIVGLANHTVLIHQNGQTIAIEDSAAPIRDRNQAVIGAVLVFHDVSYKRNLMKDLVHQAHHDALTGLPNRLLFNEHLSLALAQASRKRSRLAVLFLDLDRFKLINDTLGHNTGDLLLKAGSERLARALREGDTIARQGGDEFLVLLPEINQEDEAATITERILEVFLKPFVLDDNEVFISTSIGISIYPNDGNDIETLVKQADTAMYYAKEQGRNNYQFFTSELNAKAHTRLAIENNLRKALEREEFILHYQPQVDFESGCIVGMEALIRWNSVDRGIVSPAEFIPIAEETDLIVPIGEWVMRRACTQNLAWQKQGYPPMRIAVNISARQFREPKFVERVAQILQETELDPRWLELEITESIAMEKGESSIEMLRSIKELGVRISIDDFGTGFSSLNYLSRLPVDTLKIDQSFVRDICADANGEAVITAIILLAQNLRLKVIAEGVETETQWSFLKDKRCDEMQGYFFSKPLPSEDLEKRFLHLQG